jgi:FkbM family methyltransferase
MCIGGRNISQLPLVRGLRGILKAAALRTPLAPSKRFRRAVKPVPRDDLVRIGSEYGGWAVPLDLIDSSSICYSGGVGTDISFDLGLIERRGCAVHAFDPTPSSIDYVKTAAADAERFRFHPWGLWSEDADIRFYEPDYSDTNFSAVNLHGTDRFFLARCRSLPSIMSELGHERVDLLKLDIEGAEYEVLESVVSGAVEPTVMCVEFHKEDGIGRMVGAARRLRGRGYVAVCVDGYDVTFVAASAA